MKRMMKLGSALYALSMLLGSGCALTQKATPTDAHYFSPEPSTQAKSVAPASPATPVGSLLDRAAGPGLELRLGRVLASAHLRERIVYRDSEHELGFYDDRLWTERPDAYLRRALSQALFEERGLRSVVAGAAPVLDVELVRFEEVRKPQHVAILRVTFSLRDERVIRRAQTLTFEHPIASTAPTEKAAAGSAIAAALGEVLRSAVAKIGEQVTTELNRPQPPSTQAATAAK